MLGYHLPASMLPPEFAGRPVLGTVRNPWDYYVSWYHFQKDMPQPNSVFMVCSDNRQNDFAGTIRNLVNLCEQPQRLAEIIDRMPEQITNRGINLTKASLAPLRGASMGFYSFLYQRHYAAASPLHLIRMEALREELKTFLTEHLAEPCLAAFAFADQAPVMNTSRRGPYREYYSPELRDLVGTMDAKVIDSHGYAF